MDGHSAAQRLTMAELYQRLADALDRIPMRRVHIWIVLLVALGALFDAVEQYNVGYAAPALIKLWNLSGEQIGLLTTVTFGGMAIGSLIAGVLGDYVGRKITFMYNLVLYTLGALIGAFAPNYEVLIFGRFVVGLGLGGELNTGLTLVSELMPTRQRGAAVAIVNVAAGGAGIFLSAALAYVIMGPLGPFLGGETVSWRWLLGLLALPAVLVYFYRRYLPESPRYLLSKGRVREANEVLSMLAANQLSPKNVQLINYVDAPEGQEAIREQVNLVEIFRGPFLRRTIVLWLISWMTFGAQVAITVFMPSVLLKEGYTIVSSLAYSTLINVGGLVGSILAAVFGYYWQRRVTLGYGAIVAVAIALAFGFSKSLPSILIFGALLQLMFILLNTTTWVYAPELYPTRVRAFGTGASVVVALLSASVTPYVAGHIFDVAGKPGLLVMVAVMYAIMAIAAAFGPETHGRSLEQLSEG